MKKKRPTTPSRKTFSFDEFLDTAEGVWVWTLIIGGALILGFTAGYWWGHEHVMSTAQTVKAFSGLPLMLGRWPVFLMFGVNVLAWYIPLYRDEWQYRFGAPLLTALGWMIAIRLLVQSEPFF